MTLRRTMSTPSSVKASRKMSSASPRLPGSPTEYSQSWMTAAMACRPNGEISQRPTWGMEAKSVT